MKELDDYKNQLLETVSHNLKTPLNCIIALLDNISNENDLDKIKSFYLPILKTNSQLLLYLILDLLDYSTSIY